MQYIYAALLIYKSGKEITEDSVKAVLAAAGADVDDARVKALISALDGVDIEEAIAKAAFAAPAAAAPAAAAEAAPAAAEAAPEEEDHSEEEGMAGLGALFG
ncbi:50S ribosomal protein P1 [Methanimicrococcus blatticola]|uniref:Large ribosomal subunit protein P1 n=1 Tax=Methanimicrococcus blatticola TaxID=91560 RepID=A0A484F2Q4_9EURY|nr:50S ribosomal protein P1 [Methanimicrococcus blatticola]MBZ3935314.1 50S ribosomal protein P1 [Methanimicrococcus blatticola]MCC2508588.1 50S ribosomal protein P1 [Methanimicrococcus blatticola]TDQ67895.1 LSU ribosomal protein L12AE [Methanimicrococcus blatticola]